jgi:membrane-bound ClpP family serine protease
MRAAVRRKALFLLILSAICVLLSTGAVAQTSPSGRPVVDVAEVFGVLDAQLAADMVARVREANRDGVALLVIELDSAGALEVDVRTMIDAVRSSRVPVAVWVGRF